MHAGAVGKTVGLRRRGGTVALVVAAACGLLAASPGVRARSVVTPGIRSVHAEPEPAPASGRASTAVQRRLPDIDLDHVVVRFRSRPAGLSARLARDGAQITRAVAGTSWTELSTPRHTARRVRAELLHDPSVAQVSFSYVSHALTLPNDPQWTAAQSSYLLSLRLDRAWDISKGAGITVAVVDTGADLDHPDLAGQLVAGRNVLHPGALPQDDNGHGTLVSGIVAARTNNGRGGVGIAPSAKVMPVKVLDSNGSGSDADIAVGIDWARTHGAKVINLSLGGTFDDPLLADAVQNAIAANIVVVAAAGNDGAETVGFPASYPGVVAVERDEPQRRAHVVLELRLEDRCRGARSRHHVDHARLHREVRDRIGDVVLVADRRRRRRPGTCQAPELDRVAGGHPDP